MVINLVDLAQLSERSIEWALIRAEVKRRGHWKNKNRGSNPTSDFTRVNIHSTKEPQVGRLPYRDSEDFSDGI